jgi:hypothetical protein
MLRPPRACSCRKPLVSAALIGALVVFGLLANMAAASPANKADDDEDIVAEASSSSVLECGSEEVTELELKTAVQCKANSAEMPRIFCYRAPQFNIWRAFHEVVFEVSSLQSNLGGSVIPYVHSAADDSLHGIIDRHVKVSCFVRASLPSPLSCTQVTVNFDFGNAHFGRQSERGKHATRAASFLKQGSKRLHSNAPCAART